MTPEDVGARLVELVPGATAGISGGEAYARATVDVPADQWTSAVLAARDDLDCNFFDWLSAVDELEGWYSVVAHVWSISAKHGVLLRTRVQESLESIVDIYPGAAWHERETFEMFGIGFPGELEPLLLPPEFEGHPLRKSFVLASRVAKPWPGAKEPGESHDPNAPKRTTMRPPGVPAPGEWGPEAQ
ncbi:MAG TPA: NADH-quinone oxidoreductase subunit C [Micromonosporaceae bacterium]|nr:NADH-quinone oxidoreductase subunit C [Micromonosporaceae bacterium]HCU50354.1 NADH-quinone oxidoreductase subunit C [Micromonosporaceae bacterium]